MSYLDINHVRSYLRKAKVTFNKGDKITVNGDLSKLEGHVDVFGGRAGRTYFTIMNRDNGVFVDYCTHFGESKIMEV